MPFDTFYWDQINEKRLIHPTVYETLMVATFEKTLSDEEMKAKGDDVLRPFMIKLENEIKMHESPYDVEKLARAIQRSRSGMGGCAMTSFTCSFCSEKEVWGNTNVPNICKKCARKMAETFILTKSDILKEGRGR